MSTEHQKLKVGDKVAIRKPDGGIEFGDYRAIVGDQMHVYTNGSVTSYDRASQIYPVVTIEELDRHDLVAPIDSGSLGIAGYFSGLRQNKVVLFSDLFDEDMQDSARLLPLNTLFAVIEKADCTE